MVRLLQSNQALGRSIYGPPGMPGDRLIALRDAFEKTMRDPEFVARKRNMLPGCCPCGTDTNYLRKGAKNLPLHQDVIAAP